MIVFYSSVVVDVHSSTDNIDIHIASGTIIINPELLRTRLLINKPVKPSQWYRLIANDYENK